ncbi:MAG: RHS repeat-associated core domain-containing protein [Phycisphaerae bacterium]
MVAINEMLMPAEDMKPRCGMRPRNAGGLGSITVLNSDWSTPAAGTQPLVNNLYQGMMLDAATGLYYDRARDYSPTLGRWMEQDPAQYINGANTYQFVDSSPVENVDGSGRVVGLGYSSSSDLGPLSVGWTVAVVIGSGGNASLLISGFVNRSGMGLSEQAGPSLILSNAPHASDLSGPFSDTNLTVGCDLGVNETESVGNSSDGPVYVSTTSVGEAEGAGFSQGASDTIVIPMSLSGLTTDIGCLIHNVEGDLANIVRGMYQATQHPLNPLTSNMLVIPVG